MARIRIKFTKEHLALISNLYLGEIFVSHPEQALDKNVNIIDKKIDEISLLVKNEEQGRFAEIAETIKGQLLKISEESERSKMYAETDKQKYYGIDTYDLFNGETVEMVARIIGCYDKVIPGTECDFDGPKFPPETFEHIYDVYTFVQNNIAIIEEIVHQRCAKGGILPDVTYVAYDNEHIWLTEEEFEKHRKSKL